MARDKRRPSKLPSGGPRRKKEPNTFIATPETGRDKTFLVPGSATWKMALTIPVPESMRNSVAHFAVELRALKARSADERGAKIAKDFMSVLSSYKSNNDN